MLKHTKNTVGNNKIYLHTGDVKYAPRIIDARKTTKYNTFCVVTLHALKNDGAFILCHSATMHMTSCIKQIKANMKNIVAKAI